MPTTNKIHQLLSEEARQLIDEANEEESADASTLSAEEQKKAVQRILEESDDELGEKKSNINRRMSTSTLYSSSATINATTLLLNAFMTLLDTAPFKTVKSYDDCRENFQDLHHELTSHDDSQPNFDILRSGLSAAIGTLKYTVNKDIDRKKQDTLEKFLASNEPIIKILYPEGSEAWLDKQNPMSSTPPSSHR